MARTDTNAKQQTFSISAPSAMSVVLADDFTQWQERAIAMQAKAAGYGIHMSNSHSGTIAIASLWQVARRVEVQTLCGQSLRHSSCREASRLTLNDRLPGSVP